ncbi:MAG: hypothetical protein ONA69_07270 [candidate division KSB1 bacterium]|nr:hypothetical protein [candidate division KSB1 bacterium]MDZ7346580.1 hypothetical protein [candidate division KSB1 bacterium]MDZ7370814.1 hypothetical protein [candidate division KSB1 bacterium]
MGKDKSFSAKLAKAAGTNIPHCKVCGEAFRFTKIIETKKDPDSGHFGFRETIVSVCKCNAQEVNA